MMIAAEWGTGQVVWSIFWFYLFFLWIWLVISIFIDIMRNPELSGSGRALWAVLVVFLPFLGVFMYLIVNGTSMHERRGRVATGV